MNGRDWWSAWAGGLLRSASHGVPIGRIAGNWSNCYKGFRDLRLAIVVKNREIRKQRAQLNRERQPASLLQAELTARLLCHLDGAEWFEWLVAVDEVAQKAIIWLDNLAR
jgi:hypothetical protein